MIARVFRIWRDTSDRRYVHADGAPDPIRGATQMVFSDLGTPSVAEARGFSAYLWAREKLIALGVPASEIAFMQARWKSLIDRDPYYNPNLSCRDGQFGLRTEPEEGMLYYSR